MFLLFALVALVQAEAQAASDVWAEVPTKAVSKIALKHDLLGDQWSVIPGLLIDELSEIDQLPPPSRVAAKSVAKQLKPLGIVSVADYTFSTKTPPFDTATTRVFIFKNSEACREWWEKKYRVKGWEEHYSPIEIDGMLAVKSKKTPKIALAFGQVWITSHQVRAGEQHKKLADQIIKDLTMDKLSLKIINP